MTDARTDRLSGFVSVEYTSSFLEGLRLDFVSGFNALLGESGTGKTSVVETMRFATCAGDPTSSETRQLLQTNLKGGVARVTWRSEYGALYTIERAYGQPARIVDASGRAVNVPVDQLVRADFYGQNAIQHIARSHRSQLDLLAGFAADEMHGLQREIDTIERELRDTAGKLLEIGRATNELRDDAHEASALEEKLRAMQPQGGADATAMRAATIEKGLREREAHAFAAARTEIRAAQASLASQTMKASRQLGAIIDDELLAGPNRDAVRKLASKMGEVAAVFERTIAELRVACESADAALLNEEKGLAVAHAAQEEAYAKLLAKSTEETTRTKEREVLQRRLAKALAARKQLDVRQTERAALRARRRELLTRLSALREQRYVVLKRVAQELTSLLKDIEVTVQHAGDDTRFRELLAEALSNRAAATDGGSKPATLKVSAIVDKIAEEFVPGQLASIVEREDVTRLAEVLSETTARRVVDRLLDTEAIYEIEMAALDDVPSIKLRDGEQWKNVAEVSHGQRGSAILPIVLLLGTHPIVIDQPEDNLYARFKSTTVANIIRTVKTKRQVIFVTHDPNLVVLPVADRVNVLASTGSRAFVHSTGTMVDRRETVEEMLDGGREAFRARREFYEGARGDGRGPTRTRGKDAD